MFLSVQLFFSHKSEGCSTVAQLIGLKFFLHDSQPMKTCLNVAARLRNDFTVAQVFLVKRLKTGAGNGKMIRQVLFDVVLLASCRLLHSLNFLSFRMKLADSKTSQGIQT